MDSETASSADEHQAFGSAAADTRGKHRILAELKRVQQESKFLEEEVEELDRTDNVSTLCEETNGPINPSWDRWFEGPQDLPGCRCWML
ncbi:guanine nucleotide-binding protein subunit gamma 1-like isoform X2 [Hibiscus syriacus]|uniref:guanine nucleotide-binding protein subunit gamma 1-like isoform X2 n=1 Tax=Hibiscus syriacus TaxID=106335 RepID=UPI0019209988|nr:guanine nucleotide-binding protein subunit gamma 1-like isoform X2 [Hibiscus syriacus]